MQGRKLEAAPVNIPQAVTNAVSWRVEGIKHRKNEARVLVCMLSVVTSCSQVFLDVVESVSVLISAKGQVLRSEISGVIKMRVFLTGMPELRLGLNDKILFESTGRGMHLACV